MSRIDDRQADLRRQLPRIERVAYPQPEQPAQAEGEGIRLLVRGDEGEAPVLVE